MSVQDTIVDDASFGLMRAMAKARGPEASPAYSEMPVSEAAQPCRRESDKAEVKKSDVWPLPGLAPMTRARTSFGDVHSIALRKGDKVLTDTGEYLPIQWISRIKLDEQFLEHKPDSNPIIVPAGALLAKSPGADLIVSPRQVIAADENSGLPKSVEAAMLVTHPGVRRLAETGLTYTMFHVGQEANIYCEGLFLNFPLEA